MHISEYMYFYVYIHLSISPWCKIQPMRFWSVCLRARNAPANTKDTDVVVGNKVANENQCNEGNPLNLRGFQHNWCSRNKVANAMLFYLGSQTWDSAWRFSTPQRTYFKNRFEHNSNRYLCNWQYHILHGARFNAYSFALSAWGQKRLGQKRIRTWSWQLKKVRNDNHPTKP